MELDPEKTIICAGEGTYEGCSGGFGAQFHALASAHKALSHPARLMILSALGQCQQSCCGDICSDLPLAQSTVSQHLKVLREVGFIEPVPSGMRNHYKLNREKLAWYQDQSAQFFDQLGELESKD